MPICSQEHNSNETLQYPYRHPTIQEAVNILWFKNKDDDGTTFQEHFSPMPIRAMALVLTAVGFDHTASVLDANPVPTVIRYSAALRNGLMAHARSPNGMKSASKTCTNGTSTRSLNFMITIIQRGMILLR